MKKVALGCGRRHYGSDWIHVDDGDYKDLDYKADVTKLPFKDNSIDLLYASHVFEYFDREEAKLVLGEWMRVLKEGGELYIAVPDMEMITRLYSLGDFPLHCFVGPLYGKMEMDNKIIYHKTIYDFSALGELLKSEGFGRVEMYDSEELIGDIDDHSKAKLDKAVISLNVRCRKNG